MADLYPFAPQEIRCRRCAIDPNPNQLSLFDADVIAGHPGLVVDGVMVDRAGGSDWPEVLTSACGRDGFWRERTPAVFGRRIGVGPLLVMPDTNILIGIRERLDEMEGALVIHPHWDVHEDPVGALREVVQLWWFRDLRFLVSPLHLTDSRTGELSHERRRARENAVRELERDFLERGADRAVIADELDVIDEPCPRHVFHPDFALSIPAVNEVLESIDELDRGLVMAAYEAGCHVFLTSDKKVLRSHEWFHRHGLAVKNPSQLLRALDDSGELDSTRGGHFPVPDLSTLTRLYGGFSE